MEHRFLSENFHRENGTTFSEVPLFPEIFQWNKPKNHVPFTSQPEFSESLEWVPVLRTLCIVGLKRFDCLFMNVVKVFVRSELWVNVPVAIFFPTEDYIPLF